MAFLGLFGDELLGGAFLRALFSDELLDGAFLRALAVRWKDFPSALDVRLVNGFCVVDGRLDGSISGLSGST